MKTEYLKAMVVPVVLAGVAGCKTVSIESSPRMADVKHEANELGQTPVNVKVNYFQAKNLKVSKKGFADRNVNVNFNSPSSISVRLDREFNVDSNPSDADIYVDGDYVGKTPMSGVALSDSGDAVLEVRKQGWLPAKMKPGAKTPGDIVLNMEQDGSGRRLLNLIPGQNGVAVQSVPIFSDTEVGENSPNVSSVRRLTSQPQTEFIQNFSLMPDGKRLVASIVEAVENNGRSEMRANIWMLDTSVAGAPRLAVTTGNYFDLTPSATEEGKTLYFSSTRNGRLAIWSLDINTKSGLRLVTNANTADISPTFRPDGHELYYAASIPGSNNPPYLWSVPISRAGMPSQIREGYSPQWRPDGKKMLFVRGDATKNQAKIWVVDPDGSNPTQISTGSGEFNDLDPQWSLDGKKIIFASNRGTIDGRQNYDIWLMNADGGNLTQLTTNGSCDDKPVIAPDGRTVFFRSNRGLVWDIWVMQLNN